MYCPELSYTLIFYSSVTSILTLEFFRVRVLFHYTFVVCFVLFNGLHVSIEHDENGYFLPFTLYHIGLLYFLLASLSIVSCQPFHPLRPL